MADKQHNVLPTESGKYRHYLSDEEYNTPYEALNALANLQRERIEYYETLIEGWRIIEGKRAETRKKKREAMEDEFKRMEEIVNKRLERSAKFFEDFD